VGKPRRLQGLSLQLLRLFARFFWQLKLTWRAIRQEFAYFAMQSLLDAENTARKGGVFRVTGPRLVV
jgi:hypothetical protein